MIYSFGAGRIVLSVPLSGVGVDGFHPKVPEDFSDDCCARNPHASPYGGDGGKVDN